MARSQSLRCFFLRQRGREAPHDCSKTRQRTGGRNWRRKCASSARSSTWKSQSCRLYVVNAVGTYREKAFGETTGHADALLLKRSDLHTNTKSVCFASMLTESMSVKSSSRFRLMSTRSSPSFVSLVLALGARQRMEPTNHVRVQSLFSLVTD